MRNRLSKPFRDTFGLGSPSATGSSRRGIWRPRSVHQRPPWTFSRAQLVEQADRLLTTVAREVAGEPQTGNERANRRRGVDALPKGAYHSAASTARRPPAAVRGRRWAWRSSGRSPRATAAVSTSRTQRAAAPASDSSSCPRRGRRFVHPAEPWGFASAWEHDGGVQ